MSHASIRVESFFPRATKFSSGVSLLGESVVSEVLPVDLADWIALQEGGRGTAPTQVVDRVTAEVYAVARRLVGEVTGRLMPASDSGLLPYVKRVWGCVEYHWRRFAEAEPIRLADVVARLESGELGFESSQSSNVLRDVVIAQALERHEEKAAVMFETDYMPQVRAIALRAGGPESAELFGNLGADLILPRDERPPRIAGYRGKTPLISWLRAVVVNGWVSHTRRNRERPSEMVPEAVIHNDDAERIDAAPCGKLLQPIFVQAVASLETEDRVILKLLILDDVPQHELARSLGIHSGTLTRRRQKAAAQVFEQVRMLSLAGSKARQAADCLELLLAGNQPDLKQRLAEVLTSEIRAAHTTQPSLSNPGGKAEPS